MTYCVGIRLNAGLVFLSDSRTNAGLDAISTFRKMMVYEKAGDRCMVLLSAGNLSISQSVREILQVEKIPAADGGEPITIWNARSMFDATRVLGAAVRRVYETDGPALRAAGIDMLDGPTTVEDGPLGGFSWIYFTAPWGQSLEIASFNKLGYEANTDKRLWQAKPRA